MAKLRGGSQTKYRFKKQVRPTTNAAHLRASLEKLAPELLLAVAAEQTAGGSSDAADGADGADGADDNDDDGGDDGGPTAHAGRRGRNGGRRAAGAKPRRQATEIRRGPPAASPSPAGRCPNTGRRRR